MVEAELMIVPDLAMADLKRSMANLDRAMKASAKKAGDEFKDEMEKGMVAGAKRGAARMGGALKRNAGGIAGGIVGVLAAGLGKAIADFDTGTGLIEGRLGESNARVLMGAADLTQLDAASMAKLWGMAQKAGFDDARDFADILTNIQLKATEAETGEDSTLNQFKGLRGIQLYEEVLGSIAKADPATQAYYLDKLEAGERLPEMSAFNKQLAAMGAKTGWLGTLTDPELKAGMGLLSEEAKVKQFQALQLQAESERKAAELAAISGSTLNTWMAEQQRITAMNADILRRYEQNAQAAIPARELMEKVMIGISEKLLTLIEFGKRTAEGVEGAKDALDAQNSGAVTGAAMPGYLGGGMVHKRGG